MAPLHAKQGLSLRMAKCLILLRECANDLGDPRQRERTPSSSSRTSQLGVVYGCLVDVCGAEESGNKAEGTGTKARSTAVAQENVSFRLMLMELAADGKRGVHDYLGTRSVGSNMRRH